MDFSLKKQIFNKLLDSKYKYFTLDLLTAKYYKYDRNLNIFLAFTSSGSVAGWAIWKEIPWLWGIIIIASQLVIVLKPYFPFSKYSKEFSEKYVLLQSLVNELEQFYLKIHLKKITEEQAIEDFFKIKHEIESSLNFSNENDFNVNKRMKKKAEHRMKIYLKTNYNKDLSNYQKISNNE